MQKSASPRILTIDLLRGYFIFVIIIDHMQRFPGIFEFLTGKGYLWVSAAEGFFFISGMMVGLIRGRKEINTSFSTVVRKLWKRAGVLYGWAIGLSVLYSVVGYRFITNPGLKGGLASYSNMTSFIWRTISLQGIYGWADYLAHYAVFLFFAPVAVWLLRRGKWYILSLISLVLWSFSGRNFELAWQILFFHGMIVGFYLNPIEVFGKRQAKRWPLLYPALIITTLVTLCVSIFFVHIVPFMTDHHYHIPALSNTAKDLGIYFGKDVLAIGRVVLFGLWFVALYWTVRKHEARVNEKLGWLLLPFGQHSLYVYIVHSFLLFGIDLLIANSHTAFIYNVMITTAMVATLLVLTKKKILFSFIPS